MQELTRKILDLLHEYGQKDIDAYEIGHLLIANAVSMLLYSASTELEGIKMINELVNEGISYYEETYS